MRCTHCGTETSPENADEPVGGAALGPDDEEVRCPECVTGAHRQATGVGFAPAQPGQWMDDKVREIRLRRGATRRGLTLMKSRSHESRADDPGSYWPATADNGSGSWGCRLPVGPDAGMILDEVEEYLTYRTTRAEIMDYLSQVYGSAFVEDLIKHLPQLRAEALTLAQLRCRITALATVS